MLSCIHVEAVARAEKDDLIRNRDARNSGHVSESKIHRDSTHDWRIVLANDDTASLRQAAVESIRVSNGQNRNPRRRFGHVNTAVPQRLAGAHITQRKNSRLPGEHRLHRKSEALAAYGASRAFER